MSTIDRTKTLAPLVAGQRLRQAEFHTRYEAMPAGSRAELIGGVVVMPSPVGYRHCVVCPTVIHWLSHYRYRTPGLKVGDNGSTALDDEAETQPDASLWILPAYGGQTHIRGKIIGGAPELVVEVASSSRSIDLGDKPTDYERTGVLEYIVVALDPDEVYWHVRRNDRFVRMPPDQDGLFRSVSFPGLWLDPQALFADDGLKLIAVLERGLATPNHAAFADRLAASFRGPS